MEQEMQIERLSKELATCQFQMEQFKLGKEKEQKEDKEVIEALKRKIQNLQEDQRLEQLQHENGTQI